MSRPSSDRPRRFALSALTWSAVSVNACAFALDAQVPSRAAAPLQVVSMGDERIVTGGVGQHERSQLFQYLYGSDLVVSFARRDDGRFLSGVDVVLTREGRNPTVIDLTTAGPLLLARLPAGHYKLSASLAGWSGQHREFDVDPSRRERLYITLEPQGVEGSPAHARNR